MWRDADEVAVAGTKTRLDVVRGELLDVWDLQYAWNAAAIQIDQTVETADTVCATAVRKDQRHVATLLAELGRAQVAIERVAAVVTKVSEMVESSLSCQTLTGDSTFVLAQRMRRRAVLVECQTGRRRIVGARTNVADRIERCRGQAATTPYGHHKFEERRNRERGRKTEERLRASVQQVMDQLLATVELWSHHPASPAQVKEDNTRQIEVWSKGVIDAATLRNFKERVEPVLPLPAVTFDLMCFEKTRYRSLPGSLVWSRQR